MTSNLKKRIDRLQEQAQPKGYQTIDDIIFLINSGDINELSEADRCRIEETKDLPLHPKIEAFFKRLEAKRMQEENSTGGPR